MSRLGAVPLALAAMLLACAAPPQVDQGWYVNGAPVPDEPWRAHDGPFLAALVIFKAKNSSLKSTKTTHSKCGYRSRSRTTNSSSS